MKKGIALVLIGLFLVSFSFAIIGEPQTEDLGSDIKYGSKEVLGNISEQIKNLSVNEEENIDKELPEFLQVIHGITTLTDLIIYIAFFIVLLFVIYGVVGTVFSNKKGIKILLAFFITLLVALSGGINHIITFYLGLNLNSIDVRALSWKLIGTVFLGVVLFFTSKWFLKKTKGSAEKHSMWGMGFNIRKQGKIAEVENGE